MSGQTIRIRIADKVYLLPGEKMSESGFTGLKNIQD